MLSIKNVLFSFARDAGEQAFIDDFADMLLLKLFEVATKASQDNDKVKANAVRGLGGLLRYLPPRSYSQCLSTFYHVGGWGRGSCTIGLERISPQYSMYSEGAQSSRWDSRFAKYLKNYYSYKIM